MKMRDVFSKDYVDGFEKALEMCKNISKKQGFDIIFPDLNDLKVKK